jgi:hypothetical protein
LDFGNIWTILKVITYLSEYENYPK